MNGIVSPFIAKPISQKLGFLIMPRDGSGKIYIVKSLTPEMTQDPKSYFEKLKPVAQIEIDPNTGQSKTVLLQSIGTKDGGKNIIEMIDSKILNKTDVGYLNRGFLSEDILQGICLHTVDALCSENPIEDAQELLKHRINQYRSDIVEKFGTGKGSQNRFLRNVEGNLVLKSVIK